jgi:hypothetical protein
VSRARLLPLTLVFVLAAAYLPGLGSSAAATRECNGIRNCLRAQGPWVIVPAREAASYLLECPRRRGVVGGLDAVASSSDVRLSFDGQLGAPVAPGMTTTRYAFFRGISAAHRRGAFQPRVGCIPTDSSARSTTSVHAVPGPPLLLAATSVRVRPGSVRKATIACIPGQRLVDSWHAVAFRTRQAPDVGLADAVHVRRTSGGRQVTVTISTSEALPPQARAEVQLGVMCSSP